MLSLLAFIVTIGLLVTIHEYGHFIVARFFDIKVLRFSIGFGKPLYQKSFGQDNTELVIAAIPLGGYVQMLDENSMDEDEKHTAKHTDAELARAFNRQSVYKRIAVVLAGPISNLLLAILIYWGMIYSGVSGIVPYVGHVDLNTPAAIAGFKEGDLITQVNQSKVTSWQDVRWHVLQHAADKQALNVRTQDTEGIEHGFVLSLASLDSEKLDKQDPILQLGLSMYQPEIAPILGEIAKSAPASLSGLQTNDKILSVNNAPINDWKNFVDLVRKSPDQSLDVLISRQGVKHEITLTPASQIENKQAVGKIGAGVVLPENYQAKYWTTQYYSITESLCKATERTWDTATLSLKMLGSMLKGDLSWRMMSGPVTIANYAGQSANVGVKAFLGFLALISISIGVLNLLPIPMLDGGHFMYYVIEILTGRPVPEKVMLVGQKIGITIIGLMMMLAFYNDINRLVSG